MQHIIFNHQPRSKPTAIVLDTTTRYEASMDRTQQHFSTSANGASNNTQSSEHTLPESWYSSQEMYELERRAIFSKRWLLISHKSRLQKTGDWIRCSFASYDIIITRDRRGAINTFHNVCRHRAYPVIEKEGAGNSKILACRYHGWSYGLNGKLAKAPGYQDMDLDKDQNSLFRCHTKVDRNGFIWINLDAKETAGITFDEYFFDVDGSSQINFDDYNFDSEIKKDCLKLNWKHGVTEYIPEQIKAHFKPTSTRYFPNASSTAGANFMVIQKGLSQAPDKTTKHYELYRHNDCSDTDWEAIRDAYAGAIKADNANATTPGFVQSSVRAAITEHYKQEKAAGREIWPSRPTHSDPTDQADEDEDICAGLTCGSQKEVLAW